MINYNVLIEIFLRQSFVLLTKKKSNNKSILFLFLYSLLSVGPLEKMNLQIISNIDLYERKKKIIFYIKS